MGNNNVDKKGLSVFICKMVTFLYLFQYLKLLKLNAFLTLQRHWLSDHGQQQNIMYCFYVQIMHLMAYIWVLQCYKIYFFMLVTSKSDFGPVHSF